MISNHTQPSLSDRITSLYAFFNHSNLSTPHPDIPIPTTILLAYVAQLGLCVLGLALPLPSRTLKYVNRGLILPAIISVCVYIYRVSLRLDTAGNRFSLPSTAIVDTLFSYAIAGFALRAVDALLFSGDPHKTFYRVDQPHPPRTFTQGLRYSLAFWFTFRGINWNWRSRKTPSWEEHGGVPSNTRFIKQHLQSLAWRYLVLDGLWTFLHVTGFFQYPPILMNDLPVLSPLRSVAGLAHGVLLWQVIDMTYSLFVVPCVLLRISSAKDCPPQFGKVQDATTLAAYWATLWHSNWKKPFVGVSIGLTRFFKLPSIVGMFGAFVVSGFFHSLLALSAHGGDWRSRAGMGAMISFVIQPFGLILERLFMSHILPMIPLSIRSSTPFKFLAYVWVTLWLSTTASFAFDEVNKAGLLTEQLVPFSVARYTLDKFNIKS
ncbi:hypothetical protein E3P99_02932 [Wallemia hederae]|uniref:Wax synthase domain-containing protein n=1 Tax=Wallemia hederae TaxID=1540922 RepID=A0A4T0FI55_9BASI|nr:hypothetical protein E3P99_02932 [Wallemia hederae]